MLQKLEGDVRQHIRIEQQLKLHIESIQDKVEEDEKAAADMQIQIDRTKRERKRMDEILTLRENEISQLEDRYQKMSADLQEKDIKISNLTDSLEKAKSTIKHERLQFESERKAFSKIQKSPSEEKINFRSTVQDTSSNSSLPKRPVSRMYTSLKTKCSNAGNSTNIKDYERMYKDFMKSNRVDNPKDLMQSHRNHGMSQVTVNGNLYLSKTSDVRSDSTKKCKKRRKDGKESSRKHK